MSIIVEAFEIALIYKSYKKQNKKINLNFVSIFLDNKNEL